MLGFEQVTDGTVFINGELVNQQHAINNIAWVGQQPTIFYATISDNISLLNMEITKQQIIDAADSAGVTEYSQHLENGLHTLIGENGYGLSGGQVQRIALARAFVKNAPIVLLDEPTSHLDQENKIMLIEKIERLFKDKTLIIVSHDSEIIKRMDRVVSL